MLFNSPIFLFLFLPIVFILYYVFNYYQEYRKAKIILLFASLFFYAYYNVFNLPLIVLSIFFNFYVGKYISNHDSQNLKKKIMIIAICANLLILGVFKYLYFFTVNFNLLLSFFELESLWIRPIKLVLPLAISFFTFQQIAYIVDSYQGKTKEYNLGNYALFVSFFPQLIAGPIVHHKEMMPQFISRWRKKINSGNIYRGLQYIAFGLFKKVVIADMLSLLIVDNYFSAYQSLTFLKSWIFILAYTFQLYFDFSGYCDMAMGSGLLFNIKLPINFNSPYKAINIQDFWRRWHISLSNFLRDYIYIPLGGSRVKEYRIYFNVIITFLLGGLWHGAGWNFILWGLWHGAGITLYQIYKKTFNKFNLPNILARLITFVFVVYGWVFFKCENFAQIKHVISTMCGLSGITSSRLETLKQFVSFDLAYIVLCALITCLFLVNYMNVLIPNTHQIIKYMYFKRNKCSNNFYTLYSIIVGLFLGIACFFALSINDSPFIYFNF